MALEKLAIRITNCPYRRPRNRCCIKWSMCALARRCGRNTHCKLKFHSFQKAVFVYCISSWPHLCVSLTKRIILSVKSLRMGLSVRSGVCGLSVDLVMPPCPRVIAATVAGSAGVSGYAGEGLPALSSLLSNPVSITAYAGGFVITNRGTCRMSLLANGTLSTIVGTGTCGLTGDGGPATLATISPGWGIAAADPAGPGGGLVFAENANHVVRRLLPSGVVIRVAGTGTAGYSGACVFVCAWGS